MNYDDKRVLITGGTGSFGQRMVRRLLANGCPEVRVLSRDEAKQYDMRNQLNDERVEFFVGDVRDRSSVDYAMRGVDLVFHAAALKQVPSCEFFPLEAVKTNVIGSSNVVDSAEDAGVKNLVFLSTDKAVMPVNAMGMTKALMEKIALKSARRKDIETVVSCVRYGNVMYSRGSVIPLFIAQLKAGRPITVTNADMTRFLLSLDRAVDLVEYAFEHAEPGDIFIRKAPAATIGDLAEAIRQLFDPSAEIESIGTRHGEKLYETLATQAELRHAEDMGDYWRLCMDDRGLDYSLYFTEGERSTEGSSDDYHSHNAERLDVAGVRELLLSLPEVQAELGVAR